MNVGAKAKIASVIGMATAIIAFGLQGMTARADIVDLDAVVFTGNAVPLTCTDSTSGTLTPVFGEPGVANPVPPAIAPGVVSCPGTGNGVPLVGGSGGFNFNSTVCAGVSGLGLPDSDGTLGLVDAEVGLACSISATGVYSNIVCGTGTATGTATVTEGTGVLANGPSDTYNAGFDILFVGGIGVVTGQATETIDDSDSGPAAGIVLLGPSTAGAVPPPGGECVTAFSVTGVLATTA